jgi:hypothetical protein
MNLQDFINDMTTKTNHDYEPEEAEYKIVLWDGERRRELVLDGIDDATKAIVLVCEDFYTVETNEQLRRKPFEGQGVAGAEEMKRRYAVDQEFENKILTREDAEAYMADVIARGPLN